MNIEQTPQATLDNPPSLTSELRPLTSTPAPKRGRPRKLDELKRHEICALIAAGCSLHEAAEYVGCGRNTIRRELERNADFSDGVRRSQVHAQLSPLRSVLKASATHWRAGAWLLERAYPERFGRRDPAALPAHQARRLLNQVIDIMRSEFRDHHALAGVARRLRLVFADSIRTASGSRGTSGELRQALELCGLREEPNHLPGSGDDGGHHSFRESFEAQSPAGAAQPAAASDGAFADVASMLGQRLENGIRLAEHDAKMS